jgi:hypothetical protein
VVRKWAEFTGQYALLTNPRWTWVARLFGLFMIPFVAVSLLVMWCWLQQ